jgi:hypothetical protein
MRSDEFPPRTRFVAHVALVALVAGLALAPIAKLEAAPRAGALAASRAASRAQTSGAPTVSNSDRLMASDPVALFSGTALGMQKMPDQQTPILSGPTPGSYRLFVTGVRPGQPGGVVSIFTTSNLTDASAYQTGGVVLTPTQMKKGGGSCNPMSGDDCADYIGMEAVFAASARGALVGFYIADQNAFANGQACPGKNFYGQLGVATSPNGASWKRLGPTLRGGPVPTSCPTKAGGPLAFNQPTVIKIGSSYYAYFWLPQTAGIAVARAAAGANGLPGSWSVWSKGQWTAIPTQGGVQTIGSAPAILKAGNYVTMPWVSYNTYLHTYLMTMITHDGFYYSKLVASNSQGPSQSDIDAQKWTTPQKFLSVPGAQNWNQCQTTWENMSFITPGASDNHETGKTGLMVLSVVPGWACKSKGLRSFDLASYSFGVSSPPPPPTLTQGGGRQHPAPSPRPPLRGPRPGPCPSSNPCRQ